MSRSFIHVFLASWILVVACTGPHLSALAQPFRKDPQRVIGFANSLLQQGDAYRAISEYQAFLFFFPTHPRRDEAIFYMGKAYLQEGQWKDALRAFGQLVKNRDISANTWAQSAVFEIARALKMAGKPESAARSLEALATEGLPEELRDRALMDAARAWMMAGKWVRALADLDKIRQTSRQFPLARGLGEKIRREVPALPHRSPVLAGLMAAVVPGLGHLYAGKPRDALTSFFLNCAFLFGAVMAAREGYPVSAGILAFFELGWYAGGITSSAQRAREFNENQRLTWTEQTLKEFSSP